MCVPPRALCLGYLTQEMIDGYEPLLMFTIPRLAIIRWVQPPGKGGAQGRLGAPHAVPAPSPLGEAGSWAAAPNMSWALSPHSGLLIYPEGPLSLERSPEQMSRVFSPFYNLLKKIRYALGVMGAHGWGCGAAVEL